MRLSSMRYKNYTWPHNPETFVVEYRRQMAAYKVPLGGCVLQDLGVNCRILRGEGEFAGPQNYCKVFCCYQKKNAICDTPRINKHGGGRMDYFLFESLSQIPRFLKRKKDVRWEKRKPQ